VPVARFKRKRLQFTMKELPASGGDGRKAGQIVKRLMNQLRETSYWELNEQMQELVGGINKTHLLR